MSLLGLSGSSWEPPDASWGLPGDLLGLPGGVLGSPAGRLGPSWRLRSDLKLRKASKSEACWPEIHTFAKDFDGPQRRAIFEEKGRSQEKHTFTKDFAYSMKSGGGLLRLNTYFY